MIFGKKPKLAFPVQVAIVQLAVAVVAEEADDSTRKPSERVIRQAEMERSIREFIEAQE